MKRRWESTQCPGCGSRFGPSAAGPCLGCGAELPPGPLAARAAALGATADELRDEALYAVATAPPAAYLRLLHEADPDKWRARLMAVFEAEGGNASAVARRLGLARTGIAFLLRQDPALAAAIDARWPGRQRNSEKT